MLEVVISHAEGMECQLNKYMKRWLGVPNTLTHVAIHSCRMKLLLPVKSLVEELNVSKACWFMTLRDLKDSVVIDTQPDVRSGRKWTAKKAMDEVELRLQQKEIVGATQIRCQGFGSSSCRWWPGANDRERQELVFKKGWEVEKEKR